ncbi:hypothetical protein HY772_06880 [Candidatus Woesearchaeota archaeon]|nr:hypothetical protein [Candidatus Woesearchaeota archaeon]
MKILHKRPVVTKTAANALFILVILILAASFVMAHGVEDDEDEDVDLTDLALKGIYAASIISLLVIAYSLIKGKGLAESHKKTVFVSILISVVLATVFLISTTVYLNFTSVTGGPVHWHADYELIICGEHKELVDPRSLLLNRVGTSTLHEHNDNRIHIEGTPRTLESVNLGAFFRVLNGHLEPGWLHFHSNEGEVNVKNGDQCDGKPAQLMMFIERQEGRDRVWKASTEFDDYIPSPHGTIPPGDRLKIFFSERSQEDILRELHGS